MNGCITQATILASKLPFIFPTRLHFANLLSPTLYLSLLLFIDYKMKLLFLSRSARTYSYVGRHVCHTSTFVLKVKYFECEYFFSKLGWAFLRTDVIFQRPYTMLPNNIKCFTHYVLFLSLLLLIHFVVHPPFTINVTGWC